MDKIDEKSGIGQLETQALFSANQKDRKHFSIFSKVKNIIDMKKSEKILKKEDICKVLDNNHR